VRTCRGGCDTRFGRLSSIDATATAAAVVVDVVAVVGGGWIHVIRGGKELGVG